MAVDTAAKRASALNAFSIGLLLPIPDGTIGQGDRQHLLNLYSGITATSAGNDVRHCAMQARRDLTVTMTARKDLTVSMRARKDLTATTTVE